MLLNWVILLPLSLAAICPLERHQVCNLIAADDEEHVRENRHRCTCAITALSESYKRKIRSIKHFRAKNVLEYTDEKTSCTTKWHPTRDRPPPEQSCTNFITLDEEEKTFPVVSITFNLKESPELDAFPEESFRDTIAGALRVNQDNILILRVNCQGTKDTLTVQFGVLKPQSVAELKKKPKKRTVKGGKRDDDDNDDDGVDEKEEEEEEERDDNEGENETNDAKGDGKNTKNGRKHDDDDEKVKGNAREDDDNKKEDEGNDDGDDHKNDDDKATVSKIKKHGRKHTKIEAKKLKDEKSKKDHKDVASVKKDDKKNNGEDDDANDGEEGDDDDDNDGKHKSIGEKDDDEDDGRKHKSRGKKDDDEDDDEDNEKVHKKKKPVKGKSKHRHDDDDDKKDDEDNEDDDNDDNNNDDDDEEDVEKDDEDDEDGEEEDEETKEETEEEKDDGDEEEEGEVDYESVKYVVDQFLDAQSIATRMKAMGHLNQIADLQVDSIEFTEDIIEVEYNPDNSTLIVQTASAGGLFLFFLIIGTWCMWRRNMFDYSDDLQKV